MRLRVNENEVIDGICVYVANKLNTDPEEVDVKEIAVNANGEIFAEVRCFTHHDSVDSEDILEGIFQYLMEYHNFNRERMVGSLHFNRHEGFWADVVVNE